LKYFETLKNLFPRSRIFFLFIENNLRKFIKGLSVLPEIIRHKAELVYCDIFPFTTRYPEKWEEIFAVNFTESELVKRRNIIDVLWKINGGQSYEYLQEILKGIIPEVIVVDNIPVTDPKGIRIVRIAVCNYRSMVCGNNLAVCDCRLGTTNSVPTVLRNDVSEFYSLPSLREYWEMCFFVGKNIMRVDNRILYVERLKINIKWKNHIEYLILKTKPVHTAAILYIEWQEGD
jgi:hypothetical protein